MTTPAEEIKKHIVSVDKGQGEVPGQWSVPAAATKEGSVTLIPNPDFPPNMTDDELQDRLAGLSKGPQAASDERISQIEDEVERRKTKP